MPNLHEANLIFSNAQCFHYAIDAVAGQSENDFHAPIHEGFYKYIGCCHVIPPKVWRH